MTQEQVELKVVEYAKSADWDFDSISDFIGNLIPSEYIQLDGMVSNSKTREIIIKYKLKQNMKTKVTVLGEEPKEKELKPIELIYHTTGDQPIKADSSASNPKDWENIVLIAKDYENGFDLILVYDIEKKHRCRSLMLGHWNDGIVE